MFSVFTRTRYGSRHRITRAGIAALLLMLAFTAIVVMRPVAAAPSNVDVYLSDVQWDIAVNGWGPVELDRANGAKAANDGPPLTVAGTTYDKGLGTHAQSTIRYNLGGSCTRFKAVVGIDDSRGDLGSAHFRVFVDGVEVYDSGLVTGASSAKYVDVSVAGGAVLDLKTLPGSSKDHDHTNWADARLTCSIEIPTGTSFLSDRDPVTWVNGWGPYETDRANGTTAPDDGPPLKLDGVTYAKGIGTHADSSLTYALGGQCSQFTSAIGIDDSRGDNGSARFRVYVDGIKEYDSQVVTGADAKRSINVDVSGGQLLELVTAAGTSNSHDHTDWADAKITCETSTPPPPDPGSEDTFYLSDLAFLEATNGWGPVERDRSNGTKAAGDGGPLSIDGTVHQKGLGTHAYSVVRFSLGGQCSHFDAVVGIDDSRGSNGAVNFRVFTDGAMVYDSGTLTGSSSAVAVSIPVDGVDTLGLLAAPGASINHDHANWGSARVTCSGAPPEPAPTTTTTTTTTTTSTTTTSTTTTTTTTTTAAPPADVDVVLNPGDNIQAAVNNNPNGTTFLLKSGVYRQQKVTPKRGNTFIGENGARLNGSKKVTNWTSSSGKWKATGQTMQGQRRGNCITGYSACQYPEDLFINNTMLWQVSSLSEVEPGKWYFDYGNDTIWIGDNPSGKTVEVSVSNYAFTGSADNVTIRNLIIEKYANPAQKGVVHAFAGGSNLSDNWVIRDSEIRLSHGVGVKAGRGTKVINTEIHHMGQLGVGTGPDGSNLLVQNSEIHNNGLAGFLWSYESGGIKVTQHDGAVIKNSHIHNNQGKGIWADENVINITYDGNTITHNGDAGISHEISYDGLIINNYIEANGFGRGENPWCYGAGIVIAHSPNVEVAHNTVIDNKRGIMGIQQTRGSGMYGPHEVRNLYVHDNTVKMEEGFSGLCQSGFGDAVYGFNNVFEDNTYDIDGISKPYKWMSGNRTAAEWRGYGNDVNGTWL